MTAIRFTSVAIAVLAAAAIAAGPAHAELCFNATLDGAQAGTGSAGTGIGKFVLSDDELTLTYKITFSGLGAPETAAHIHSDVEGGGVVKDLGVGDPKIGQWTSADVIPLNAARVAALKAGQLYVNIHSTAFPGGEIKGQILDAPCEEQCFEASIDGSATGTPGTGFARLALNHTETELNYWIEFSGLTTAETASHIHSDAEGGGVVHGLGTGTPKVGTWTFLSNPALTAARVNDLKAGLLYVNIHSTAFPGGELSGTITSGACQPDCFAAAIDGPQAGTSSSGGGTGNFLLSHARNRLAYNVTITNIVSETASHIHNQNEADAVVENLGVGTSKSGEWDNNDLPPMDKVRVIDLMNGAMYVNVHTIAFPGGEVRGQMMPIVCSTTSVGDTPARATALLQNYPNPFNPSTTIAFSLASEMVVTLDVYDVSGRRVARLAEGVRPAGRSEVTWDGIDASGNPVASGIYLYRLVAGGAAQTRKMVLLK